MRAMIRTSSSAIDTNPALALSTPETSHAVVPRRSNEHHETEVTAVLSDLKSGVNALDQHQLADNNKPKADRTGWDDGNAPDLYVKPVNLPSALRVIGLTEAQITTVYQYTDTHGQPSEVQLLAYQCTGAITMLTLYASAAYGGILGDGAGTGKTITSLFEIYWFSQCLPKV